MPIRLAILIAVLCAARDSVGVLADDGSPPTASVSKHWSLLPRTPSRLPAAYQVEAWRTRVDAYIAKSLSTVEWSSNTSTILRDAGMPVFARRLSLDLLGLPPSIDELAEGVADDRPDAVERLTDRLLADPRYGEHWGKHWLDVVRYAETEGFEYDQHRPGAWRYRDYVINSWNDDRPFDQFLREQLAGDETPSPSTDMLAAVGFHRLGPIRRNAGNSDVAFSRNEVLTEMTDGVGAIFLGLTLGCARCHDHKFDPISQADYYHLQAFLATAFEHDVQLAKDDEIREWKEATSRIKTEVQQLREKMQKAQGQEREEFVTKIRQLEASTPAPLPTISSVRNKDGEIAAVHVLARGDTERKKELVGPRFLAALCTGNEPEFANDVNNPKSKLADWLVEPNHPLTARVIVNRIWHFHFGRGIVETPNDFGINGTPPSHPELLDDLANRFVESGWQIKSLHRHIVLSSVYRQKSLRQLVNDSQQDSALAAQIAKATEADPSNKQLWHFPRRRLDAEQLRDSMLAVSGSLNSQMHGESVIVPVDSELVSLLYKPSQWEVTADKSQHHRRSVYLLAKRNLRVPFMEVFDQPDLQISCSRRTSSTHSPQALEMLNGEFANEMAELFASRLQREAGGNSRELVTRAFLYVAGREPTLEEMRLSSDFVRERSPHEFALAMLNLNSFLYVE